MGYRGNFVSVLALGLLAAQSSKHPAFELFSQDVTGPAEAAAWDTLVKGVDDGDAKNRKTALAAAGTIGPMKEALDMVARGLQDKDREVRQVAATTLGEMGSKEAVPHLKAALDDVPEVSFTAAKALWALGAQDESRDIFEAVLAGERKDAPGKMHNAMKDLKKRLTPAQLALMGVSEASGILGPASMGIDAAREAMKELKKDNGTPGRAIAAETLAKDTDPYSLILLMWSLGDSNWAVRLSVAKALGDRGNQETIGKLQPLLKDDHHAVRYMAAASIIKLNHGKPASTGN